MKHVILPTLVVFLHLMVSGQNLTVTPPDPICAGEEATISASADGLISYEIAGQQVGDGDSYTQVYAQTTEVTVKALVLQDNIVVNGDFENGDVSFNSDYQSVTGNTGFGQYRITDNANNPNPQWFLNLADHTSGSGNLFVADGNTQSGVSVYRTEVNVQAGVEYIFSAWVANVHVQLVNPPILEFNIGGQGLGQIDGADQPGWFQFYTTWTSNTTGTITIELTNENTQPDGNDFAIDDIVFAPIEPQEQVVEVVVNPYPIAVASANNYEICQGESVFLSATSGMDSYSWSPSATLSDATVFDPTATPTATTEYTVSMVKDGCEASTTVEIVVGNELDVDISPDVTICENGSTNLFASGGDTFSWTPVTGLDDATSDQPVATPTATTTYTVDVESAAGCTGQATVTVTVETDQDLGLPTSISICDISADSVIASAPVDGVWSGTRIDDAGSFSPATAGAGNHTVTFTPDLVCITPVDIPIEVRASTPTTISTPVDSLCANDSPVEISADVALGNWSGNGVFTNGNSTVFDPSQGNGAELIVFFPDAYCQAADTAIIVVVPLPDATITQENFCLGQGAVQLQSAEQGGTWSGSVGIDAKGWLNVDMMGLGDYHAIYEIANGECAARDSVGFGISSMSVDIGPDSVLCSMSGKTITFSDAVGLATNYEWTGGSDDPSFTTSSSGTFTLTGSDEYGCSATDTVFVEDICPCEIFIPNAFTPNGDDRNERFFAQGRHELTFRIQIFTRWGQVVYDSDDMHEGWDGRFEGEDCPPDLYTVKVDCPVGGDYVGTVQLLR